MPSHLVKGAIFDLCLASFGAVASVAYVVGEAPAWIFVAGVLTAFIGSALTFEKSGVLSNVYIDSLIGPASYIIFGVLAALGSLALAAIATANTQIAALQLLFVALGVAGAAAAMTRAIGRSKNTPLN